MQQILGTTSYIYPVEENNFIYNVETLSKEFPYIQLLCFGKNYIDEIIGEPNLIKLKQISVKTGLKYILHLPLDLNLLDSSLKERQDSLDLVKQIIEETKKHIDIEYYIMHMDRCIDFSYPEIELNTKYKDIFSQNLEIMQEIMPTHMPKICLENTSYDLTFFADQILKTKLKTCLDIGHIYLSNDRIENFTNAFNDITKVIHLHGVNDEKDHLSLKEMPTKRLNETIAYLKDEAQEKITIIEVFNRENLDGCLDVLTDYF